MARAHYNMAALRLTLPGGFEARLESGLAVTFPRKKSEALLAYLALHAGQMQPRDKLAALLWGEASDTTGDQELRALFPAAILQQVARLIRATRRRSQPSPKSLQNLRPRAASRS